MEIFLKKAKVRIFFCKSTLVRVTNSSGRACPGLGKFKETQMMKTAFLSIAIGLLIFTQLSGVRAAAAADVETLRQRTDRLVKPYLDNDIIVGMTIGVLRD